MQPKGGSFTGDDKDFLRFKLGDHQVIPAFEEAVATMKVSRQGCGSAVCVGTMVQGMHTLVCAAVYFT